MSTNHEIGPEFQKEDKVYLIEDYKEPGTGTTIPEGAVGRIVDVHRTKSQKTRKGGPVYKYYVTFEDHGDYLGVDEDILGPCAGTED